MHDEVAISFENVSKVYNLHGSQRDQLIDVLGLSRFGFKTRSPVRQFPALNQVSLCVRRGARVGIIGRNGAGKTTLLKLISGVFGPTAGSISVNGTVQALMGVGLGFHPEYTGRENVEASLHYNGLNSAEHGAAVEDVAEFCELGEFFDQPIKTYSLGMQGRLQFAVATVIKPEILIIDEILGSGDMYFSAKSAERISKLAFSGCTLVVVSHDLSQILKFCDEAIWLHEGQVKAQGSPQEIVNAYEVYSAKLIETHDRECNTPEGLEANPPPEWLAKRIAQLDCGATDAPKVPIQTSITEYSEVLEGGQPVFRWPGLPGVKFARIETTDGKKPSKSFKQGGLCAISYSLRVDHSFAGSIRIHASLFGKDGERKAWITSHAIKIAQGTSRLLTIQCLISELHVGSGDYLLSTSIFSAEPPEEITKAKRYDLVSRCISLSVTSSDRRSPAVYSQPSTWSEHIGNDQ